MLKLLSKLFNRDLTIPSEPIETNVSDDEIWKILHPTSSEEIKRRKKSLQLFVQFCTSHLSKTESQRLCRIAKRALDDYDDSFSALHEVMSGEDGQKRGRWVFIQFDWKTRDEIAWQVSEVLAARGTSERWERDCLADFRSVPEALIDLSEWLLKRNMAILHFETNSDFYCSIVINSSDIETARKLAVDAELVLYDHTEFAERNA